MSEVKYMRRKCDGAYEVVSAAAEAVDLAIHEKNFDVVVAEINRKNAMKRWHRDFNRAAQHYLQTGKPYVAPPTANERLLTAIFGKKKGE
jgi:hypothetical protein